MKKKNVIFLYGLNKNWVNIFLKKSKASVKTSGLGNSTYPTSLQIGVSNEVKYHNIPLIWK